MSCARNVNLKITSKNFLTTAEKYESKIWEACMNEKGRGKEWNVYAAAKNEYVREENTHLFLINECQRQYWYLKLSFCEEVLTNRAKKLPVICG